MNQIRKEIVDCMGDMCEVGHDGVRTTFCFPKFFSGFKGHFPENPTFPGMCVIQTALCVLGEWKKRPVRLREILLAKYYHVLEPGQEIDFECREYDMNADTSSVKVKVNVAKAGERLAELRLEVLYAENQIE